MDMSVLLKNSSALREHLMTDHTRPGYHFICPEDNGVPGDPNAAFYAGGRVHLMFLYHSAVDGFRYGHMSSRDLLHWRRHPDALMPDELDAGIFSGGAFVDEDGTVYISYWALNSEDLETTCNGIRLAYSRDAENNYEKWEKMPALAIPATSNGVWTVTLEDGTVRHLAAADPSNIWKKDGVYYMQAGNLPLLNQFGRDGKEPIYAGDYTDLYRSRDLVTWEYLHRFYERDASNRYTDESEDDMCPSFLPLPTSADGGAVSDKYLQLFISHNKGCQYYIGDYDRSSDLFLPQAHGRMTWVDNTFFAPEALMLPDGRQVMWAWLCDRRADEWMRFGWSGIFGVPRTLWLRGDGALGIAPLQELKSLRGECVDRPERLRSTRFEAVVTAAGDRRFELRVLASEDGTEYVSIGYDPIQHKLFVDTEHCGSEGRRVIERAPLQLEAGELLQLNVFVDGSIVEVFANERQAISRLCYPTSHQSNRVVLTAAEQDITFAAWELDYTNPY